MSTKVLNLSTPSHIHPLLLKLSTYVQEMTPKAKIITTKYIKSVLKSSTTLSYVEARARMDDRYDFIPPYP